MRWWVYAAAAVCASSTLSFSLAVQAQAPAEPPPAATTAPSPCAGCVTLPALTPVKLELLAELSSKVSKSGQTFPIRLAEPIIVAGKFLVPAGATGMGEVVHAKGSGDGGAAGELVLAARYLDVDGQQLRLRSLNLASNGKSNTNTANTIGIAGAASPLPISIISLLITGGQTVVPKGTVADAKTAAVFTFRAEEPGQATAKVQQGRNANEVD